MALFKRKDKDGKRKGENAIGKIIYGFLLFMPLIAILSTILVNTFNKETTGLVETSEVTYKFETNEVNSINDIYNGRIYKATINQTPQTNTTFTQLYAIYDLSFTGLSKVDSFSNPNSYVMLNYVAGSTRWYLQTVSPNNTETIWTTADTNIQYPLQCYVAYKAQNTVPYEYLSESDFLPVENVTTELVSASDNNDIFYYSIQQIEESNLFNWAKSTGTYTVLETTCNGIGITNTFIPMLMAYWLIISVIYFIFDIALILIWAVHDKIHELKDAI